MLKTPVTGFIRYSCKASFSRKDFFCPAYMDYRLDIFKNITLKSFQEQTDKDFNIFLLHSESLPEKYKDIFKELEDSNIFLHNIYISDTEIEGTSYLNAVQETINSTNFYSGISINFRIDNDDALPCDYIQRIKTFLNPAFSGFVISLPNVTIVQRTAKNIYTKQEIYFPANSIGLAYVTAKKDYKTIMTLGDHGKINKKHPMILLPCKGGIQTISGTNIMNSLYFGHSLSFDHESLSSNFRENGYAYMEFDCLNVCKRRIIMETLIKTKNFIKKRIVTKE